MKRGQASQRAGFTLIDAWLNPLKVWQDEDTKGIRVFRKQSALVAPGSSKTFCLIDENPLTVNDAYIVVDLLQPNIWVDTPASYHNGAGGLSFCDDRAEIRRWHDSKLSLGERLPRKTSRIAPLNPIGARSTASIWPCAGRDDVEVVPTKCEGRFMGILLGTGPGSRVPQSSPGFRIFRTCS